MRTILSITKREINGYFATPVAYVFIVIFLIMSGLFEMNSILFFVLRKFKIIHDFSPRI